MIWYRRLAASRAPDFVIGPPDDPYMRRWWVIPRNRFFNIYLHQFLHSDDDRALHDHPWMNVTWLLEGGYWEHTFCSPRDSRSTIKKWYDCRSLRRRIRFRLPRTAHRVELVQDLNRATRDHPVIYQPCWSLFITGPVAREWGFHCPNGWRHWKLFTAERDKGQVGRGCE